MRRLPTLALVSLVFGVACAPGSAGNSSNAQPQQPGDVARLGARPGTPTRTGKLGLNPIGLSADRDGLVFVPFSYDASRPMPLVLMLHGAGGTSRGAIRPFLAHADSAGVILVAPESRAETWDLMLGRFGPDVAFIDRVLRDVFSRFAVDRRRVAIEGFSDGASYALSLGIMNGDLFSSITAFSPGLMRFSEKRGMPRIFIAHGTEDQVLHIERASRRLVPTLAAQGYDVEYHEFTGQHAVPDSLAQLALERIRRPR